MQNVNEKGHALKTIKVLAADPKSRPERLEVDQAFVADLLNDDTVATYYTAETKVPMPEGLIGRVHGIHIYVKGEEI
jgi:hypothetical protein